MFWMIGQRDREGPGRPPWCGAPHLVRPGLPPDRRLRRRRQPWLVGSDDDRDVLLLPGDPGRRHHVANRQPGPPPLCKDITAAERSPSAGRAVQPDVVRPRHRLFCNPHELRNPLLGASLVWTAGAILSVISVADAWQHRERQHSPGRRALARGAIRASFYEPLTEAQLLDGDKRTERLTGREWDARLLGPIRQALRRGSAVVCPPGATPAG